MNTSLRRGLALVLAVLIGVSALMAMSNPAQADPPLTAEDFSLAASQGFGDRQNSWAWSMQWWNGHLYVGTNRAWHCAETAAFANAFPNLFTYPPDDPDVECTPTPEDLPLQAEIWRWTPETDTWERVYQSPADVPLPGHPGKFVARDIGYRGMTVFREADGTEALYVTGVSVKFIGFEDLDGPPARILRSTDGVHFEPIPQDPGIAFGDLSFSSFRNPTSFNGRFYVVGGGVGGSGMLLESAHPEQGNDSFRVVTPLGIKVSALHPFNGYLYLGLQDFENGYSVVKTDASGPLPYRFIPVVEKGGYLVNGRNPEVLSMAVFDNRLYVGGNGIATASIGAGAAAELIRINPDDSWDVVAGYPRMTSAGYKFPISGLMAGFGNVFNGHMWRMAVHEGVLYVGTFDTSTTFRNDPELGPFARRFMGFDLYASSDGIHFSPITTDGFGDPFNFGARTLASTPYGLFLGTANYYYGLQIWLGVTPATPTPTLTPTPTETPTVTPTPTKTPPVEAIVVSEVRPRQAINDVTSPLEIFGRNFPTNARGWLDSIELPSTWVSGRLASKVRAGLPPGTYDVSVTDGEHTGTLPQAFTLRDPGTVDDLEADSFRLWTVPVAPRDGVTTSLGLLVHRLGGEGTLPTFPVRFYLNSIAPGNAIGDGAVAELGPDGSQNTSSVEWGIQAAGVYTIWAEIDPENIITETDEANNVISRTVEVLATHRDTIPPTVTALRIRGGEGSLIGLQAGGDTETSTRLITLTVQGQDNPGGSGVAQVFYAELHWSAGARSWQPVQWTEWLPYGRDHVWELHPESGMRYIQAWLVDRAGNISAAPMQALVNYIPAQETILEREVRVYRKSVMAGECLTVQVTPISGDPDLYVWPPAYQSGDLYWYSLNGTGETDEVQITAPRSGLYQIEVVGFTDAAYQLTMTVTGSCELTTAAEKTAFNERVLRSQPIVPTESEPPAELAIAPVRFLPGYTLYLPVLFKAPERPGPIQVYLPLIRR